MVGKPKGGVTSILDGLLQVLFAVQRPQDFHLNTQERSCPALPQITGMQIQRPV